MSVPGISDCFKGINSACRLFPYIPLKKVKAQVPHFIKEIIQDILKSDTLLASTTIAFGN